MKMYTKKSQEPYDHKNIWVNKRKQSSLGYLSRRLQTRGQLKFWNAPTERFQGEKNLFSSPTSSVRLWPQILLALHRLLGPLSWQLTPELSCPTRSKQSHVAVEPLKCGQSKMKRAASAKRMPSFQNLAQKCRGAGRRFSYRLYVEKQ